MNMYIYAVLLCDFILVGDIVITSSVRSTFTSSLQNGWTALMKASNKRHDDCVELLLSKGANINQKNKVSAVSQSIIVCLACSFVWK